MPRYTVAVNGQPRTFEAAADTPLLWVLRDTLDLPGTKYGCGIGQCGACTIHVNGVPMRSCMIPASIVAGMPITTIEGLSADDYVMTHGQLSKPLQVGRQSPGELALPADSGQQHIGVEGSQARELNLKRLRHAVSRLTNWPYDQAAAEEFGRPFISLKRLGRPMQQIDIQIAAIALSLKNCVVITTDSDLLAIPGLATDNWSLPKWPS